MISLLYLGQIDVINYAVLLQYFPIYMYDSFMPLLKYLRGTTLQSPISMGKMVTQDHRMVFILESYHYFSLLMIDIS